MAGKDNLSPEEQKVFDLGFAEAAQKSDAMQKEFEKMKLEHQAALKKLTDKDSTIKATEEEKAKHLARLEELENAGKSEKERADIAVKKAEKALADAQAKSLQETEGWKSRYFDTLKRQALSEAIQGADLYDPSQAHRMLKDNIQIEEVKNGDKIEYVPFITLDGADGNPVKHKIKDGLKEFLTANPNLIKSKIIRDESKTPEGIILRDSEGKAKTINLNDASVDDINKHFDEIHQALGEAVQP